VQEDYHIFALYFTSSIHATNITMTPTSALKRLCSYRSAVVLAVGFPFLIAVL